MALRAALRNKCGGLSGTTTCSNRGFLKSVCVQLMQGRFFFFFFLSVVSCALWEVNWSKGHAGYCKEGYPCVAIGEILVLIDCLG